MSYIDRNLLQDAVVWQRSYPDGYGGYAYSSYAVKCRWEERSVLFTTNLGEEKVSKAIVYVNRDVEVGSFISLTAPSGYPPVPPEDAFMVLKFNKSPNLKATEFERKVII